jgi:uncharacterized protein (TIGR03492 family)
MMDGLEGTGDRLGVAPDATVVAMLPGTRADAEDNFIELMRAAVAIAQQSPEPARLRFLFPVRDAFDPIAMASAMNALVGTSSAVSGASDGVVLTAALPGGAHAVVAKGRFADILQMADIAVGMAGTANEQAVGLGIPLVAVPSRGVQGERFVRMKMQFFGEAAVSVPLDPEAIAAVTLAILADPAGARRMGDAGRERMGSPGASRAIAAEIVSALHRQAGEVRAA